LIAQAPVEPRDGARLLVLAPSRAGPGPGLLEHRRFLDLPDYFESGDLLVLNETRVLPARLFGSKSGSGGRVEVLLLRPMAGEAPLDRTGAPAGEAPLDPTGAPAGEAPLDPAESWEWEALVRPGRRVQTGTELLFDPPPARTAGAGSDEVRSRPRETQICPRLSGRVVGRTSAGGRRIVFRPGQAGETFARIIEALGQPPLPPYITRPLTDPERYQTVFARVRGSAAAPTAGLHFTPRILESLRQKGVSQAMVTLHIGLDTFRPVREEEVENHRMHSEWYEVPPETAQAIAACRARGGRVVACGTTVVRTLESAADPGGSGLVRAGSGRTRLFIYPGYSFGAVDAILTNFHLPRSTLLMLVSAFGGRERVLAAYEEAARLGYRFYSLGDAMLVFPPSGGSWATNRTLGRS